jgi:GTP cyclohydrolase I
MTDRLVPEVVNVTHLEAIGRELIIALGEDPDREGLQMTPHRFAQAWQQFIEYDPGNTETIFEAVQVDQLVVVSGIKAWSMCEHHLLPFRVDATIGILTSDHVLGLSKYARVVQQYAHRLQLQERLTKQIADEVQRLSGAQHLGVIVHGHHLCAAMRGVSQNGMIMHSSDLRGMFRDDGRLRAEFMELALHGDKRGG